jgi:hypothetical protein
MMQEVAAVVPQVVTVTDRQRQHIQLTELAVPQVVLVAAQAAVQGANKLEVVVLGLVHLVGRLGKEMATKVMVVHGGVRLVVEHHVETITLVLVRLGPSLLSGALQLTHYNYLRELCNQNLNFI